jgi:hypothetical protein
MGDFQDQANARLSGFFSAEKRVTIVRCDMTTPKVDSSDTNVPGTTPLPVIDRDKVFISYASEDRLWAERVRGFLEAAGIRCWIAPRDIVPGTQWMECIISAIDTSRIMVLILSKHANQSEHVRREVVTAVSNGLVIIPCCVGDVNPRGALAYATAGVQRLSIFSLPIDESSIDERLKQLANIIRASSNPQPPSKAGEPQTSTGKTGQWIGWPILGGICLALFFFFTVHYLTRQIPPLSGDEPQPRIPRDTPQSGPNNSITFLHFCHAALIAGFFFVSRKRFSSARSKIDRDTAAKQVFHEFEKWWTYLWCSWLLAYGLLFFISIFPAKGVWPDVVTDALDCLCSCALFLCFLVLDQPIARLHDKRNRDAFRWKVAITFAFGAAIFGLAAADRIYNPDSNGFGVLLVGLYAGLAMAFLVGRFDSKWLDVDRWQLVFLYGYALIQVAYPFMNKFPAVWSFCIFGAYLVGKLMLFVVVNGLLRGGELRDYLEAAEDGNLGRPKTPSW